MENHTHGVYGNRGIAVCPCPSVSYGVLGILCVGESLFGLDDLAELGFPFPLLEGWRSDTCARGSVEAEGLGLLGGASCGCAAASTACTSLASAAVGREKFGKGDCNACEARSLSFLDWFVLAGVAAVAACFSRLGER